MSATITEQTLTGAINTLIDQARIRREAFSRHASRCRSKLDDETTTYAERESMLRRCAHENEQRGDRVQLALDALYIARTHIREVS